MRIEDDEDEDEEEGEAGIKTPANAGAGAGAGADEEDDEGLFDEKSVTNEDKEEAKPEENVADDVDMKDTNESE